MSKMLPFEPCSFINCCKKLPSFEKLFMPIEGFAGSSFTGFCSFTCPNLLLLLKLPPLAPKPGLLPTLQVQFF